MILTKQKAIRLHREMWKRISEMTDEDIIKYASLHDIKNKILKDMDILSGSISNSCFCCEYVYQFGSSMFSECMKCPIYWECEVPNIMCADILVKVADRKNTMDFNEFRKIAKEISELPESEDKKDE